MSFALPPFAADQSRLALAILALSLGVFSCTPKIGDKCTLSTDCSVSGDRLCDTSQPGGYCTQFNCTGNTCPDDAACVLFNASIPGCGFDDRNGSFGARTARAFCIAQCSSDSDCRPGYLCADPRTAPWSGLILDDNQTKRTCVTIPPDFGDAGIPDASSSSADASVCSSVGPDVPPISATPPSGISDGGTVPPLFPDAGTDAGSDAGLDAGADAGHDAGDGG